MRSFEISSQLRKNLEKLFKKDKKKYGIIINKIKEIVSCEDVNHYKNLRKPLNYLKRVHIDKSFVLTFEYKENFDIVIFMDLDHHDKIYK